MNQSFDIAVVGATGTVGETLVQILEERDFPVANLHLLASSESAGSSVPFRGKNVRVREVDEFDFSKAKLVFFAAGPAVTLSFAAKARAAGCSVIDLSGALPTDEAPQIVPESNGHILAGLAQPFQISSPSPSATALAVVLAPLRQLLDLQRVTVTACLAVSAQGREAVSELARQTTSLLNMHPLETRFFDRQMAFNLLAQVGKPDEQGHVPLEKRLVTELREVLGMPGLKVSVTCIQAPVFFGDSYSVSLQLAAPVDLQAVNAALEAGEGIEWVEADDYPTAVGDAVGQDVVYVGRVRHGVDDSSELNLWLASDNVRKGAALNAVQLAELLIKDPL
ncbi:MULTISPECIES: aspartate-semialdehyde dehydrogenase [unclassified Pseudomonas]|uniref:aspartate-semialdehyde dehydrogenase n=1 Tax=unclassified Pseudomonas TaxID=196821 RepID=UPI001297BB5B|nr:MULTISPECIES: aspartate-semialdehyde dehydrogenase [unclassified Pseudomonas]MQT40524.1 aspartate-semialdehyde dehydrogenase [Pseudomonas sp. FSL R10-0765]MQT52220.1 aspartate-semialdehyde dehydrogenase [Pseudomonas sp. FSL R10-2398]MQU01313.1 aspartate-semialdehyde dehydrogenase [Pseudomonas sp. FSL R10-2245]MQU11776.1 aspartate-semialdehyde dehydrogenase [Pseudomonas sp. FSL R10-2189]MQU37935.1 aspartate-semialdehyde dehydrogenase [Pseudomonas sp. FSL R10-2172]